MSLWPQTIVALLTSFGIANLKLLGALTRLSAGLKHSSYAYLVAYKPFCTSGTIAVIDGPTAKNAGHRGCPTCTSVIPLQRQGSNLGCVDIKGDENQQAQTFHKTARPPPAARPQASLCLVHREDIRV